MIYKTGIYKTKMPQIDLIPKTFDLIITFPQ